MSSIDRGRDDPLRGDESGAAVEDGIVGKVDAGMKWRVGSRLGRGVPLRPTAHENLDDGHGRVLYSVLRAFVGSTAAHRARWVTVARPARPRMNRLAGGTVAAVQDGSETARLLLREPAAGDRRSGRLRRPEKGSAKETADA